MPEASMILVTGGTGFVGSHIVRELVEARRSVRILARSEAKVGRVLGRLGSSVSDVVIGDMTDESAVARALNGVRSVVHCAAEIGVAGGTGPISDANVRGAELVVGGAVDAGVASIVYTSSIATVIPTDDAVITARTPLATAPLSSYAEQKIAIDRRVDSWVAAGAPITTLVLGGVYGPGCLATDQSAQAVTASMAMGMLAPQDAGANVIDVRDIATIAAAAASGPTRPGRYLLSGHWMTWREWATALGEATGTDVPFYPISPDEMIQMGRDFDRQRATGAELPPLSEAAALLMCASRPGDDSQTFTDFGISYRSVVETFRDMTKWLAA